ncbi:MAG: hypothetical protein ABIA76_02345 [Candidatus Diapherotrites archaeon]
MKLKLFFVLIVLLFSLNVFAGGVGDRCDYDRYADSECDTAYNIYCINDVCTEYVGSTEDSCTDSDGDNQFTSGNVGFFYRNSNGEFVTDIYNDRCMLGTGTVISCSAEEDCNLKEFICLIGREINYSEKTYSCEFGCSESACLVSLPATPEPQEGDTCNYSENDDDECDAENNLFCVEGECTLLDEEPVQSCIDSETDVNIFFKGEIDYAYRDSDGSVVSGTKLDSCTGNKVKDFFCLSTLPNNGQTFDYSLLTCESGCSKGACVFEESDSNDDLPESITNQQLLQFIDDWSKGELGESMEENDLAIQEIIEIWKNS